MVKNPMTAHPPRFSPSQTIPSPAPVMMDAWESRTLQASNSRMKLSELLRLLRSLVAEGLVRGMEQL